MSNLNQALTERPDIQIALSNYFLFLAKPGYWWHGAQKVAIAAAARAASTCALCAEKKAALSRGQIKTLHPESDLLSPLIIDMVHQIITDQGLSKTVKEKLAKRRGGRAMKGKGKAPRDVIDKIISDSTPKDLDLVKKLTASLEKAFRSKDPIKGTLEALATWAQEVCVEKLGKPALKSLEHIFNNPSIIPNTLLGWASGKWVMPPVVYKLIDGAIKCIGSALVSTGFVLIAKRLRDWWSSSVVIARGTPRRDEPQPTVPDFGGGGPPPPRPPPPPPPPPPSTFDRSQRNRLNELFRQQQASIEAGIIGSSGGGSQLPPGTTPSSQAGSPGGSGFDFGEYFRNLFSQPPSTGGSEDDKSGDPTNDAGAGAVAIVNPLPPIQFGGQSEPHRSQFGAGIPSGRPEQTPWDPFNILATAAFLAGANRVFTNPTQPTPEMPQGQADSGGGQAQLPRDDGLGFEDEFEQERFEMDEAERARQEAEQEDEEADLKAIMPPPSSVEVAGSLFGGLKTIPASSFDAVRAAKLASKIFDQMASAVNQVETIDESLQLKEAIAKQQVIERDIQDQLIRRMVTPADESIIEEEMVLIEGLVQDSFEIIASIENGSLEINQGLEILQSTARYITNVLEKIPKGEVEDEVSRLRIIRATLLRSIGRLREPTLESYNARRSARRRELADRRSAIQRELAEPAIRSARQRERDDYWSARQREIDDGVLKMIEDSKRGPG